MIHCVGRFYSTGGKSYNRYVAFCLHALGELPGVLQPSGQCHRRLTAADVRRDTFFQKVMSPLAIEIQYEKLRTWYRIAKGTWMKVSWYQILLAFATINLNIDVVFWLKNLVKRQIRREKGHHTWKTIFWATATILDRSLDVKIMKKTVFWWTFLMEKGDVDMMRIGPFPSLWWPFCSICFWSLCREIRPYILVCVCVFLFW